MDFYDPMLAMRQSTFIYYRRWAFYWGVLLGALLSGLVYLGATYA